MLYRIFPRSFIYHGSTERFRTFRGFFRPGFVMFLSGFSKITAFLLQKLPEVGKTNKYRFFSFSEINSSAGFYQHLSIDEGSSGFFLGSFELTGVLSKLLITGLQSNIDRFYFIVLLASQNSLGFYRS